MDAAAPAPVPVPVPVPVPDAAQLKKKQKNKERRERQKASRTENRLPEGADRIVWTLDEEIEWFCQQFEMGLRHATREQAAETRSIMSALKSATAPLARKRQLMHVTIPDYRERMSQDIDWIREMRSSLWKKDVAAPLAEEEVPPALVADPAASH
ncbi:hypothetical protein PAPYR_767 [Paratrimastix pyriformis]|uniref:Uncharacterized protein n=1 Tax=Paratrimastix pyriformis TaxID=342808 RepID=A0ABQ8V105_9EUKA|nr:hypothetical protein PAPYR_767 [Paratrimastix pyriformis]